MEEEPIEAYNSDSGDGDFQMDEMSDDNVARGAGDGEEISSGSGWISWFCSLEGHEYMIDVEEAYIRDQLNLEGLQYQFSKDKFKQFIKMILSPNSPNDDDLADEAFLEINQEASDLYGLIHSRYINTPIGMAKIYQKFLQGLYGYCPRALCDRQKVLPVGLSDSLKVSRFKVFCPRCDEVYIPKFRQVNIDGAFFGTSFPHHFLKHYKQAIILPPKIYHYEPKISGFKIHGKRGSKYFDPPKGNVEYNFDSMTCIDKEKVQKQQQLEKRTNRFAPKPDTVEAVEQKLLTQNFFAEAGPEVTPGESQEDTEAVGAGGGKKKNKKNKKK